jgi:ubiquinone/menaquinone biosynthesis C-methylase UbiE
MSRAKALAEAYRVLKVGGRFMCLEFSHVSLPVAKDVYDLYSFEVSQELPCVTESMTCGDAFVVHV